MRSAARRTVATSSANVESGSWTAIGSWPAATSDGITPRQLDPSAQKPCTRITPAMYAAFPLDLSARTVDAGRTGVQQQSGLSPTTVACDRLVRVALAIRTRPDHARQGRPAPPQLTVRTRWSHPDLRGVTFVAESVLVRCRTMQYCVIFTACAHYSHRCVIRNHSDERGRPMDRETGRTSAACTRRHAGASRAGWPQSRPTAGGQDRTLARAQAQGAARAHQQHAGAVRVRLQAPCRTAGGRRQDQ